jgi:hypothetical protein
MIELSLAKLLLFTKKFKCKNFYGWKSNILFLEWGVKHKRNVMITLPSQKLSLCRLLEIGFGSNKSQCLFTWKRTTTSDLQRWSQMRGKKKKEKEE